MAAINFANIQVIITAITRGFSQAISGVSRQLRTLQQQAAGIASSFRFIGAAAATGGLFAGISVLADFEDGLAALKGALSGTIEDAAELDRNVALLGRGIRGLALDSRFTAVEITDAAIAFTRAGFNARQTFESLRAVQNLAASENLDIGRAADISINILKGLRISAAEFERVVDIIVNAGLAANVTVEELGSAFTFAATVLRQFDQSAEETASLLALLGDSAFKGTLGGTSLRQIVSQLITDTGKANSVLDRFGISIFESGEKTRQANDKIRPLSQILRDIAANVSLGDTLDIFQTRALSGFLGITGTAAEDFERLLQGVSRLGTAERLAEFRANTLKGELFKLKAAVTELFLAVGVDGGLLGELRKFAQTIGGFALGLAQSDKRTLQFIATLATAALQVGALVVAFVTLAGAASALLSPLGAVASAFLTGFAGERVLDRFRPELEKLAGLFAAFAKKIGADFGIFLLEGLASFSANLTKVFRSSGSLIGGLLSDVFSGLTTALFDSIQNLSIFAETQQKVLEESTSFGAVINRLAINASELSGSLEQTGQVLDDLATQRLGEAKALVGELEKEFAKLAGTLDESVVTQLKELARISAEEGKLDIATQIEGLVSVAEQLEEKKRVVEEFGNKTKILAEAAKLAQGAFDQLAKNSIGEFAFETQQTVQELEKLREALLKIGESTGPIDDLIERFKAARAEIESTVTIQFGAGLQQGIRQLVDGLISGTREGVKASEVFKAAVLAEFRSLFEQIILKKLMFDKMFKDNFFGLGEFVAGFIRKIAATLQDFVSGPAFSATAGGAGTNPSVGSGFLSSIVNGVIGFFGGGSVKLAKGGIALRPMLATVGDSKEAIIPLSKLENFVSAGGGGVVVNNFGAVPPDQIAVREAGSGRDRVTELVLGIVAKDINRGGITNRANQSRNRIRTRVER